MRKEESVWKSARRTIVLDANAHLDLPPASLKSVAGELVTDTFAVFNDPTNPRSINLGSGLYNLTITAVDNAFAVGTTAFFFVVNHDPETWFEPKGNPNGYYHPPFLGGEAVDESVES